MDSSKKYDNPSPEDRANPISKLLFCWILPFFKLGYKNNLEAKDLYNALKQDLSEPLGDLLEKNWKKEVLRAEENRQTPELSRAIRATFLRKYMVCGIVLFIQCVVLRMIHPLFLAELINYFDPNSRYELWHGWLFATLVVAIAFINALIMHHVGLLTQKIGMRCRVATCSLIYRKLLKLSKTSAEQTASGQVINLLSNDVARFDIAPMFLHYLWIMPIQAIVAGFIMYRSVGYAAIAGLVAIALQAVPLQGYLASLQGKMRAKIATKTDYRVRLMSEIMSGIQVIKMYAWEKPFELVVETARKLEIDIVTKTSYIRGFSLALMVFTERFTLFLTVITYVLEGNRLTGDKVFSMAQFFNTIQLYMAILYPIAVALLAEASVSVKRIQEFLLLPENVKQPQVNTLPDRDHMGLVRLSKVQASWISKPIVDTLSNITFTVQPGTLCAIVGSIGSGKSSILHLLLNELPIKSGKLEINGLVSYASQEPWLFVASVRNNILFGREYEKNKYKEVVEVCALEEDLKQFNYGDRTLVGERGVSLSGGQRARINLARAVYREADIYLFDDPLSAVDAHVGKHLFKKCIKDYLKDKTRIIVTHQLQFLKDVDMIVIVNNGLIERVGTYENLCENELAHLKHEESPEHKPDEVDEKGDKKRLNSVNSVDSNNVEEDQEEEPEETQELMESGKLSSSLYKQYFLAGTGIAFFILLIIILLLAQTACNASDMWVKHWTNSEEILVLRNKELDALASDSSNDNITDNFLNASDADFTTTESEFTTDAFTTTLPVFDQYILNVTYMRNETTRDGFSQDTFMWTYTVLIIASILLTTLSRMIFFKICMNSSRKLHNSMFSNVLKATMRFFDTNPSGRILNRFSKDMGAIDELLPRAMMEAIQIMLVGCGILIMVFLVRWWMIFPTIILALLFYVIRVVYLASAQDIKRLEGISKAPVFSHIMATFNGISTIRVCDAQSLVSKEFDVLQDQHTGAWSLFLVTSEAFGFYLDVLSVLFLAILTFQFLIFKSDSTLMGDVGLVISQSLILTGMLQYGMRQTAEVTSQMTSVERVIQYTKLDKEGPFESDATKKPHRDWPQNGAVSFENLSLRYSPTEPPVLKNLNFQIKPGEKVGIVGRTGAGKSSLISALFRLNPIEGNICIDNVDTKTIGLHDLRSNISIIPQEPTLFSASLRSNLDPFEKCSDEALWKALSDVELKDFVETLQQTVSEGGKNFSAGERQLICLARAILRNNKILVMDEATANVDPQTDALIQNTIRKNFKNCTVLTIAHRLNTVMDSDKVLVMDAGEVVEFGIPYDLLKKEGGFLSKMVAQTGSGMEKKLRAIAFQSFHASRENLTMPTKNETGFTDVSLARSMTNIDEKGEGDAKSQNQESINEDNETVNDTHKDSKDDE